MDALIKVHFEFYNLIMVEATKEHTKKDEIKAASDALPLVERILDPYNDRQVKDLPKPPRYPMSAKELYITSKGKGHFR
jgi:hypothetical protein